MMQVVGRFVAHKVVLADELVVAEHVQLLAGAQLFSANATRKAVQVEHFVARLSHKIGGSNALATAAALGAVSSEMKCSS